MGKIEELVSKAARTPKSGTLVEETRARDQYPNRISAKTDAFAGHKATRLTTGKRGHILSFTPNVPGADHFRRPTPTNIHLNDEHAHALYTALQKHFESEEYDDGGRGFDRD